MPEVWATRWRLTCPDCGKVWAEILGYGRWHAVGGWDDEHRLPRGGTIPHGPRTFTPEGPKRFAEPGAPVAHSETKRFPCSDHSLSFERIINSPLWIKWRLGSTRTMLSIRRSRLPDDDGTKSCLVCGRRFKAGRRDAVYCSTRCRKTMHRWIARDRAALRGTRWEVQR